MSEAQVMDRCPKCGDTEYGFGHGRWERFGGRAPWGEPVNDWDTEGEIKPDRYASCMVCGHRVPWRQAYGEQQKERTHDR